MMSVKNLTVFYENAIAVNEISLEVHKGEIIGVIGPNSAGKTTLANSSNPIRHDFCRDTKRNRPND